VTEVLNFKFLSLHIEKLLPKWSTVCYTIRTLSSVFNIEVLRIVYFANFKCLLENGLIFWGNSSHVGCTFLLKKIIIRSMVGVTSRCSCRSLFRKIGHLTPPCLYIYLLMIYVVNNWDNYHMNSSIDRRYKNQLHRPVAKFIF